MSCNVHHIPGRVRFKIPELQCNEALIHTLHSKLTLWPGVERVDVRRASCSVIIHYDPRYTDVDALILFVEGDTETAQEDRQFDGFDAMVTKSMRHIGVVFGRTAFKVALEQVLRSGINSAYRAASMRA